MQDVDACLRPGTAHMTGADTEDNSTGYLDLGTAGTGAGGAYVHVTTGTDLGNADNTLAFKLECADNTSFTAGTIESIAFDAWTPGAASKRKVYHFVTSKRYIRQRSTAAGTTPDLGHVKMYLATGGVVGNQDPF
jgi:hypothetical protein